MQSSSQKETTSSVSSASEIQSMIIVLSLIDVMIVLLFHCIIIIQWNKRTIITLDEIKANKTKEKGHIFNNIEEFQEKFQEYCQQLNSYLE